MESYLAENIEGIVLFGRLLILVAIIAIAKRLQYVIFWKPMFDSLEAHMKETYGKRQG